MQRNSLLSAVVVVVIVLLWRVLFPDTGDRGSGGGGTSADCGDKFAHGRPEVTVQVTDTTFLCRGQYAVLHDDARKVPLYSAERLVGSDLAADVSRTDDFRPDEDLPAGERAELEDYRGSGFDRGHMTPAADSDTTQEMSETFLLSNMVPQNGPMNQGIWSGLESATRACAEDEGEIFVITGPVFDQEVETIGRNDVEIPDAIYKVAYDAQSGEYRAFVMPNRALPRSSNFERYEVSIAELERQAGLRFFPQGDVDGSRPGTLCPQAYGS